MPEERINDSSLWNRNTMKIIAITLLIAALILITIVGIKRMMPGANDIRASVSTHALSIKDSVSYKDSSDFAKDYRWNFGDNTQSFSADGWHKYNSPGNYVIQLTINGKFTDTFLVTVADIVPIVPLQDSVITIDGPIQGMQFENLVFRAKGVGASQYRWKFLFQKYGTPAATGSSY